MMAVNYARIVLTEEDRIKYLLPCKSENKHLLKAADKAAIRLFRLYVTPGNIPASTFPVPFSLLGRSSEVLRQVDQMDRLKSQPSQHRSDVPSADVVNSSGTGHNTEGECERGSWCSLLCQMLTL